MNAGGALILRHSENTIILWGRSTEMVSAVFQEHLELSALIFIFVLSHSQISTHQEPVCLFSSKKGTVFRNRMVLFLRIIHSLAYSLADPQKP